MTSPHATTAILSIGDELTLGQSLDTNSRWVSDRLVGCGIIPIEHVTVPDDLDAIAAAMVRVSTRADLVITTGGLGPTADDLTRPALARAMGDELVEDGEALGWIERWFTGRGREMPPLNRTQAMRPARARMLPNAHGTAPGLAATIDQDGREVDIYCLPGPPSEMTPMFEAHVAPALRPPAGRAVITRVLHTYGIGESDLAGRLGELMDRGGVPLVGTTASKGVVSVRIRYEGPLPREAAEREMDRVEEQVRRAAAPFVFGRDGQSLPGVVLELLKAAGQRLAVVESCTGGMLGEMLTEVPGSSDAFVGGWITYSNELKVGEVAVPAALVGPGGPGAVSKEVASAMAVGGMREAGVDRCLAITGIAGPGGGSDDKPVGTVWIALASRGDAVEARRFLFTGAREVVRHRAAMSALAMLRLALAGDAGTPMIWQTEP